MVGTLMAASSSASQSSSLPSALSSSFVNKERPIQVRLNNINAAKSIADMIRTSLGPKGMDKMIRPAKGSATVTNDGATILKQLNIYHPCALMLRELSEAQDAETGDGTTTVVILAGALLTQAETLLKRGIHPSLIAEGLLGASREAIKFLKDTIATPIDLQDRDTLIRSAMTSLNSKVVSIQAQQLATIAVDAVRTVHDHQLKNADLRDIRIVQLLGGTVDDSMMMDGLVISRSVASGTPSRQEKAKIALCQFCLSHPKPDTESQVVIKDYTQMDRFLRDERNLLLTMCKKIKKTGCNVLLMQKSILRDAVNELALHYLAKLKITVVTEIERDDVEFVCKTLGCRPIADIETFTEDRLGSCDLLEEKELDGNRIIHITGIKSTLPNPYLSGSLGSSSGSMGGLKSGNNRTISILLRGGNQTILDEAKRSLHDALCVVRSLVRLPMLVPGGGAPESACSLHLIERGRELDGVKSITFNAFGEALQSIPVILAENAGLSAMNILTEILGFHGLGVQYKNMGVNIRKACVGDMMEEKVIQPLLVTQSAIQLATETVVMILKIDDFIQGGQ